MHTLILAVSGGISAYKASSISSAFRKNGYYVITMQTPNSKQFITPASLKAMSDVYFELDWGEPTHINVTEHLTNDDIFLQNFARGILTHL